MDQPTSFDIRKILGFSPPLSIPARGQGPTRIVDGEYIKAHKCVSFNEPFFQGISPAFR